VGQSETSRPTPATGRSARLGVALAVVCSACALIAGMTISPVMISRSPDHCGTQIGLVFPLVPALILHLDILVRLRREPPQKGIMLALAMGSVGIVLALLALTPLIRTAWVYSRVLPLLIMAAQAGVLLTAGRAYSSIRPKPGESLPLAWAGTTVLAYMLFILVLGGIANNALDNPGRRFYSNQARAATFVRDVTLFEFVYSRASGGYSPTLAMLSNAKVEGMPEVLPPSTIELLTRQEDQGYIYRYTPGPLDESGQIRTYTITARPRIHLITGCLSLFADESGVVRGTKEDRVATARDLPLGG
jgi:hypothetical protein